MYRYKRLLVGLKLSDQDIATIRYAAMVSRMARSEKIYFIHVAENLEIPEDVRAEYPDLLERADELARNHIEEMVSKYFDGDRGTEKVYKVAEGTPLAMLLEWARRNDIDLIVTGRKQANDENSKLAAKLVRKAPCSVFIIPAGSEAKIGKILVPVDFSENSVDAMETAVAFASAGGARIECLHVYQVPTGYHKTGKTYEEFAAIMKSHAEKDCRNLISKLNLRGLDVVPIFELKNNPWKAIKATAQKEQADLLVMGSRGRSAAAAALLGSVTERLIRTTDMPLLAVKKKGANLSLLEAILKL
jgi:nucleotide-binding universal stress UspA family protein